MLKKLLILCIAIAPLAAVAQQTAKFAYLNTQEIFNAMPELAGIEKQLNDKQEEIRKTAQELETELNTKSQEFENLPATTSETVKQNKQREIQQIYERYQVFAQNSQQELQQLQQKLLEPVNQKIANAIRAVGDENSYTFIFNVATMDSPIVYVHSTTTNITQAVKTKLGIN